MPYRNQDDPVVRERAKAYRLKHYYANKQTYIDRAQARNEARRKRLSDLKASTPCKDCGVQYPPYVMQFDHREGEPKVGELSRLIVSSSEKVLQAEIAKCDIVCANCHCERTHRRQVAAKTSLGA